MKHPKILEIISPDTFTHLQAFTNYTILYTREGEKHISGYCLKVFEELLNNNSFIRIDRSNLVNTTFIKGTLVRNNGYYIKLKNNSEILIPRRKKAILEEKYPDLFFPKSWIHRI